jgi:3-oxoacyl-[acyl-carrier protein] reductase
MSAPGPRALRRALVTGATGTIGRVIAQRLADAGLHVCAHSSAPGAAADALLAGLRARGGSAELVSFDVTDREGSAAALSRLLETGGPIQAIVNNAGVHADAPLAGMSWPQWQRVIDVSVNGFFNVTQPLLLPMIRTRWGRIVNISSLSAVIGNAGQVNYAAAKAALHGATKALAKEVASRGITVMTSLSKPPIAVT